MHSVFRNQTNYQPEPIKTIMEETRQKAPGNGHFPAVLRFVAALLLSGTLCLAVGGEIVLAQIRSIM